VKRAPAGEEELVPLVEAARRHGEHPAELRRRLEASETVRLGAFEAELRTSSLVALRRVRWGAGGGGEEESR
jgi:hypothetical protein